MNLEDFCKKEKIEIIDVDEKIRVGGYLNLEGTGITQLPDNLTVGGYLDLENTQIEKKDNYKKLPKNYVFEWESGYIKADGIFTKIIDKKGGIYKVQQIGKKEITYLIITEDGICSHGETFKKAKESLIYKISDRDTSEYENMNLETEITFSDAIKMYRKITGACEFGVKSFLESKPEIKKDKYTIKEIIKLTKDQFDNNDLINFFKEYVA